MVSLFYRGRGLTTELQDQKAFQQLPAQIQPYRRGKVSVTSLTIFAHIPRPLIDYGSYISYFLQ